MAAAGTTSASGVELGNMKDRTSVSSRAGDDNVTAYDRSALSTDNDRYDMRRMGKKQEFRRNFATLSTIGFTTCVMGTWEILLV